MNETKVKVFGMGNAGISAINKMVEKELKDVEIYAIDSKLQLLDNCKSKQSIKTSHKIIDEQIAHLNNQAIILKNKEEIEESLKEADMVFIICEMDNNSISIAQTVAKSAKNIDALTIGIVIKPFQYKDNIDLTEIENFQKDVDAFINIPSKNITDKVPESECSLKEIENTIYQIIKSLVDMISIESVITVDFVDLVNVLKKSGTTLVGVGMGAGENRVIEAASKAVSNSLLEANIKEANKAIVHVTGCSNLTLFEIEDAVETVRAATNNDINIIFGAISNDNLTDEVIVTVIATDFYN